MYDDIVSVLEDWLQKQKAIAQKSGEEHEWLMLSLVQITYEEELCTILRPRGHF